MRPEPVEGRASTSSVHRRRLLNPPHQPERSFDVTLLDQAATRVADAVESRQQATSRLHPPGSFDLADHLVPTGREEAWRFTPMKRLRGVHDGTFVPGGRARVEVHAPPGVVVDLVDRDDSRLGRIYTP